MPAILYKRRSIPGAAFLQVTASWPGVCVYLATCGRDVVPVETFSDVPTLDQIRKALVAHGGTIGNGERAARLLVARGIAREAFGSYGGTV